MEGDKPFHRCTRPGQVEREYGIPVLSQHRGPFDFITGTIPRLGHNQPPDHQRWQRWKTSSETKTGNLFSWNTFIE
jgi:hypothetical protein